jgi:ribosome modulation factor
MTAYEEGYAAFERGHGQYMNPYDVNDGPEQMADWDQGWNDAETDALLAKGQPREKEGL